MLTADQIDWARQHDWFRADYGNGSIAVYDDSIHADIVIDNWRELREFAGY